MYIVICRNDIMSHPNAIHCNIRMDVSQYNCVNIQWWITCITNVIIYTKKDALTIQLFYFRSSNDFEFGFYFKLYPYYIELIRFCVLTKPLPENTAADYCYKCVWNTTHNMIQMQHFVYKPANPAVWANHLGPHSTHTGIQRKQN